MNPWNDLLISTEAFDQLSPEQLAKISASDHDNNMTLCHGVAAIGNLLAVAALNEDTGLSLEVVADIGWLLESLGKLSTSVTDRGNAARSYSDWHKAQKREV
jgi:hypothetical protein